MPFESIVKWTNYRACLYVIKGVCIVEGLPQQDVINFFKSKMEFTRIINSIFDVFLKNGRIFGAGLITNPTLDEAKALSEFFKQDYYNQDTIRISLADFQYQMQKTFNVNFTLADFFNGYNENTKKNSPLNAIPTGRHKLVASTTKTKNLFTEVLLNEILPKYKNTPAADWIQELVAHMRRTYRVWLEEYSYKPQNVINKIEIVANALNNLSELPEDEFTRISDFSKQVTGNSETLSFKGNLEPLFLRALANHFKVVIPTTTDAIIQLYLQAGLLAGGSVSYVTVLGLQAFDKDDKPNLACDYYNQLNQPHMLTLENISHISTIKTHGCRVYIVENPLLYTALCERVRNIKCTIICPAESNYSAFLQLTKICIKSGAYLYYAGNMDYKGLRIADKLYLKYKKYFVPWRYAKTDYELVIKNSVSTLLPDERRDLAMHNEDLASLLSLMRRVGKTADSMPLIPAMIKDIQEESDLNGTTT